MKLTYEGQDYTLEFTRRTVERMEEQGFSISEAQNKPLSTLPTLFAGSFLAHHRYLKEDTIDKIFAQIPNKEKFMLNLIEMYAEPINALFDEPQGEAEKNAVWEANF